MRRRVFLILMLLWMAGIFAFSSRSGSESSEDSYFVGTLVGDIFVPGFDEWTMQRQQEFAEAIDHPVRKTAHAAEYAVLALLAAGVCIPEDMSGREKRTIPAGSGSCGLGKHGSVKKSEAKSCGRLTVSWAIAAAYAATDEFHQLFVPGRSGQVSDVILDSAGALAGLLILALVRKIMSRRRNGMEKA